MSVRKDWADWGVWIFSGLLVVVGFLQVWLLCSTLRAIKRQAGLMEEQTGILEKSVAAAEASAEAADTSIILTHRPKLIVRSVVVPWRHILRRRTPLDELSKSELDDGQLGGFFYAVNVGNQPATIRTLDEYYFFGDILPMERPYEAGTEQRSLDIGLKPGEAKKISLRPRARKADEISPYDVYDRSFWVIGRVGYTDELGNSRETGFCRRVDRQHARMLPVDDPDYEYAD